MLQLPKKELEAYRKFEKALQKEYLAVRHRLLNARGSHTMAVLTLLTKFRQVQARSVMSCYALECFLEAYVLGTYVNKVPMDDLQPNTSCCHPLNFFHLSKPCLASLFCPFGVCSGVRQGPRVRLWSVKLDEPLQPRYICFLFSTHEIHIFHSVYPPVVK